MQVCSWKCMNGRRNRFSLLWQELRQSEEMLLSIRKADAQSITGTEWMSWKNIPQCSRGMRTGRLAGLWIIWLRRLVCVRTVIFRFHMATWLLRLAHMSHMDLHPVIFTVRKRIFCSDRIWSVAIIRRLNSLPLCQRTARSYTWLQCVSLMTVSHAL